MSPYYEKYASPYVDSAKPHLETAKQMVFVPALDYGNKVYDTYGRQRVDLATAYGQKQWDSSVKPRIELTQRAAIEQYQQSLAPHVDSFVKSSSPYFDQAKSGVISTYGSYVLPACMVTMPYLQQGYEVGYTVAADRVFPYLNQGYQVSSGWVGRNALPQLFALYVDNIEPQLVRIGERLGRYSDRRRLKAAVPSTGASVLSAGATAASKAMSAESGQPHSTIAPSNIDERTLQDSKPKIENKGTRATELEQWQEQYAAAVSSGRVDLEKRISDLLNKESAHSKSIGQKLLMQLEATAAEELSNLKEAIKLLAHDAPEDADVDKIIETSFQPKIKHAASAVKEKAQAIRQWRQAGSERVQSLVATATASTLEILDGIRDLGLQDIGLRWSKTPGIEHSEWVKYHEAKKSASEWRRRIEEHKRLDTRSDEIQDITDRGMQVTEDAAKELGRLRAAAHWKISSQDASDDFSDKVVPPKVAKLASKASEAVLEDSQTIAGSAASILSEATEKVGGAASAVSQKVADASDAVRDAVGTGASSASSAGTVAASSASSAGSAVSSAVSAAASEMGEKAAALEASSVSDEMDQSSSSLLSALSEASESAAATPRVVFGAMAQQVDEPVIVYDDIVAENSNSGMSDQVQDFVSAAGDRWSDATRAVYQALLQPTNAEGGPMSTMSSVAAEQYASALSAASVVMYGTTKGTGESVVSAASSRYNDAVYAASVAIYGKPTPVLQSVASQAASVGASITDSAMLQYAELSAMISELVSGREPDFTESVMNRFSSVYYAGPFATAASSASSVASEAYVSAESVASDAYASVSSMVSAVSSAGGSAYSQIPSAADIYDGVSSNVDSIVAAASAQVYGTPKGSIELAQESAASVYNSAKDKASRAAYGTLKGAMEQAQESAASVYNDVKSKASGAVYGTEKGSLEQATSSAASAYNVALESASIALYGTQKSQLGMARESAASAYSDVLSRASEGIYGTKQKSVDAMTSSASSVYSAALARASTAIYGTKGSQMEAAKESAHSMYQEALAKASEGIYGTQTGVVEQAKSSVASVYESAISAASEAIYGTQRGPLEEATDSAGSAYAAATDSAANAYSAALSMASEAAASASSFASEAGSSASSVASSIGSVAGEQLSAGSKGASEAIYSTSTGSMESMASCASEAIYGSSTGSIESMASRASEAVESVTKVIGETVSSVVNKGKDEL